MQLNKLDNVIFLKNVESNIIEEAIIVLKENIKIKDFDNKYKNLNEKINVLKETEMLINNELQINDLNFEKYKLEKLNKKYKFLKIINIFLIIVVFALIFK